MANKSETGGHLWHRQDIPLEANYDIYLPVIVTIFKTFWHQVSINVADEILISETVRPQQTLKVYSPFNSVEKIPMSNQPNTL